jgi:uncharacterized protein
LRIRSLAASIAVLALTAVAAAPASSALEIPEAPSGRVNDYAGVLNPADRGQIEAKLASYERESTTQVVVATFRSLEGEDVDDFTNRLFERWRLGQKDRNNGVLLAVFLADRRARIEVGYGLEARLTDALASRILHDELAPHFRKGDYGRGIDATVEAIVAATRGEYQPKPRHRSRSGLLPFAFVILVLFGFLLSGIHRSLKGGPRGRPRPPNAGPFHPGGYWGGGWSGGGGGFYGGGGGGFSGGGGLSGGGGASGSW